MEKERHMRSVWFMLACLGFVMLVGCGVKPVLKNTTVEALVHQELDLSASYFFDPVGKESKIQISRGHLDVQTLGTYPLTLVYDGNEYKVKIKVVDKEKPVVRWKQRVLVFPLHAKKEYVNAKLRAALTVTDNYDVQFASLKGFTTLPDKETSVQYDVLARDRSGNVSKECSLYVQFTKSGKQKSGLREEVRKEELNVVTKKQTKEKKAVRSLDTKQKTKHEEPIQPTYPLKEDLPMMTVDNFPDYLLGNSNRVFSSYEEAYAWANEQIRLEGGPWYGCYMEIGQPYDGDYANAGEASAPWTVQFFK